MCATALTPMECRCTSNCYPLSYLLVLPPVHAQLCVLLLLHRHRAKNGVCISGSCGVIQQRALVQHSQEADPDHADLSFPAPLLKRRGQHSVVMGEENGLQICVYFFIAQLVCLPAPVCECFLRVSV